MPFLRIHQSPSIAVLFSRPVSPAPSSPSVSTRAFSLIRKISIADLSMRKKHSSSPASLFSDDSSLDSIPPINLVKRSTHKSKKSKKSGAGIPSVPPLPPLYHFRLPPISVLASSTPSPAPDDQNIPVHFNACEFLTLDPEPWVGISLSDPHPLSNQFELPPLPNGLAKKNSLVSLWSLYSSRSYDGDVPLSRPSSHEEPSHARAGFYEGTRSSPSSSSLDTPSTPQSLSFSHISTTKAKISSPLLPSPAPKSTSSASPSNPNYFTLSYLPEFRPSVIKLDAPPPRPPRRHLPDTTDTRVELPLLARRLTSSSSTKSLKQASALTRSQSYSQSSLRSARSDEGPRSGASLRSLQGRVPRARKTPSGLANANSLQWNPHPQLKGAGNAYGYGYI